MADELDVLKLAELHCEACITGTITAKNAGMVQHPLATFRAVEFTHSEPPCETWKDTSSRSSCFPAWLRGGQL